MQLSHATEGRISMIKLEDAFRNGKAFIPFVTCGDPDTETTIAVVKAMVEAGANIIELGIPFSDPTAEGPVIQEANIRALSGGMTTDKAFETAARLSKIVDVPLVFMTYANVVYSYECTKDTGVEGGTEHFIRRMAECGVSGLILPDVPYEEKEDFAPICRKYGVEFVSLIAPTSKDRIRMIAKEAEGFVYCVSSLGVTGVRSEITTDIKAMVDEVRSVSDIPVAIGFGISTPAQAADMAEKADGVIVGSAIVKQLAAHGNDAAPFVREYVEQMVAAIRA